MHIPCSSTLPGCGRLTAEPSIRDTKMQSMCKPRDPMQVCFPISIQILDLKLEARYSPSQRAGKPRRLQPEGVEPDFQFYRPELELTKPEGRTSSNASMQTPLLDWSMDRSIGLPTPDTPSSSSNDNCSSWQHVSNSGHNEFPPQSISDLDNSGFQHLMSPVEFVRTFATQDSMLESPNGYVSLNPRLCSHVFFSVGHKAYFEDGLIEELSPWRSLVL